MRRRLFAAAAAFAITTTAQAESVRFQAGDYTDFRQLVSREAPTSTITVSGTLSFPVEKRNRYPAVVIVHTIGGYQEPNEGWHADQFRKSGFATLTYQSPTARRMADAPASSGAPPWGTAVAEAYAALRLLARDPRIDPARIAIVGFSFGGEVAHLSAFARIAAALALGDIRFAAHIAYYPAGVYGAAVEREAYTGAPILMLLGEKDDNLPIDKAQEYFSYARGAGSALPIDVSTYPGAHHAWTVPGLGAPRFYPQYASARKCPYLLIGSLRPTLLVNGRETLLDPNIMQTCLKEGRGYSMGYDAAARARSTDETKAFLRKSLAP
jgi:dienelactone hydrolase